MCLLDERQAVQVKLKQKVKNNLFLPPHVLEVETKGEFQNYSSAPKEFSAPLRVGTGVSYLWE